MGNLAFRGAARSGMSKLLPRLWKAISSLSILGGLRANRKQLLLTGVGVEKVTLISGMRISRSMLEESIRLCSV
jgi:hypothetical protein